MKTRILALAIALCALLPMASASVAGMMREGSPYADTLNTIPQPDTVRGKADSVSARKVVSQAGKPQEGDTTGTKAAADSIPQRAYTILPDTSLRDSLYKDTVRKSKSALEEPVSYSAKDSITFDYTNSRAHLFGGSQVNYQNLQLTADDISLSLDSSLVHASGRPDSTGAIQGKPLFKQGEDEYEPDRISYNFKTRKAFISNVYTQEGEGFMQSREGKCDSSGVMYVQNGKYTTCDAEHPHFYVSLTRAKMHPGKNVIFGPAYLVVEDVPLPLAIPYGFFPFSSSYKSGFIMPTYGDETTRGFYLRDGGYYFAINDKVDLKVLGEFYTKGSWGLSAQTNYKKRYRFGGNFFFSYQNTKEGEKNMPDYSVSKSFKLTWSHRQDAKANPTQSFSASVNFATSSYERNNLTSMYNPESYTQSTRTSSVSYSKTFSKVGLTLSGTFNLSQNMRDSSISVTLPTLSISQSRFNPFKRKKAAGKERWYEKIAMSYTGTLANSINTKEDKLFHSSLVKDWRNGMRHQVPISASFSVLNYINVTPSFTFTDRMYTHKVMQGWDTDRQAVQRDTVYGFYNVYNYNMSISANTKLYGMYRPMPWFGGKKIAAIRHVFTPTVSFSYAPDFSQSRFGFYDSYVKTDANGNVSTVRYSPFSGMMYGTVGQGMTGSVTMDVANNIEMKVRTDKDSTGYRKISLIDELGGSLSYNMAAKRRPWSDLNLRARIKLTKKYTYSMNAVFATYAYEKDENGRVYVGDHTEWSRGRFGRFQGTAQNISYSISNETFRKLFGKKHRTTTSDDELDEELDEEEETDPTMQNVDPDRKKGKTGANQESNGDVDEDGYLKFSLPWSINIGYGVTIRENTQGRFNDKRMRYPYKLSHTLNFSGNIRISEGWNINFSSGYDFNMHKLSMTTASLSRDLHCFQMSCSMVISPYTSYNFTFACKAGTLADALKWKKQSSYSSNIDWY
ncbi:MAG: putative LPS assembly protein LptD [Bacteroidaceae bacterium]|nr:putative LPS assembly protein LptD [Bacteroidaceae bacterium]